MRLWQVLGRRLRLSMLVAAGGKEQQRQRDHGRHRARLFVPGIATVEVVSDDEPLYLT